MAVRLERADHERPPHTIHDLDVQRPLVFGVEVEQHTVSLL